RAFDGTLVSIRANSPVVDDDDEAHRGGWGPPVSLLYPTGPCYSRPLTTDVAVLGRWLLHRDPAYLLVYPTALAAIIDWLEAEGQRPRRLREVRTVGEVVPVELRAR